MRVLIDGRSLTQQMSGISRYILELTKGYIRKYGEENVITIVNSPIDYFPFKYLICPYERHKFVDNIKFSIWLFKQDYNIYHAGDMLGPFWHAKGVKHITTCHDLIPFVIPNSFRLSRIRTILRKFRIKFFFKYIVQDADMIISVSKTTHDDLKRIYGVDSFILREGINKIFCKEDTHIKYEGLGKNTYFLYVGLGSPYKNIDFLVNAFLSTTTEKKLVICGKGHNIVDSPRIIYTGYVEDECLDYLYKNCAAFIFPSKYEGFGLPILEALSYCCKVFSSNAGSLGEFSPGVVQFFNPNEKQDLIDLINDCDDIVIDKEIIEHYLQSFDWEIIWHEFHEMH